MTVPKVDKFRKWLRQGLEPTTSCKLAASTFLTQPTALPSTRSRQVSKGQGTFLGAACELVGGVAAVFVAIAHQSAVHALTAPAPEGAKYLHNQ